MDVELEVKGLNGGRHNEKEIKEILLHLNGVKHVEVHLNKNSINVDYDQTVIQLEEICNQMEEKGFHVIR